MVVCRVAAAVAIPIEVGEDAILEAEVRVVRYGWQRPEREAFLDESRVGVGAHGGLADGGGKRDAAAWSLKCHMPQLL